MMLVLFVLAESRIAIGADTCTEMVSDGHGWHVAQVPVALAANGVSAPLTLKPGVYRVPALTSIVVERGQVLAWDPKNPPPPPPPNGASREEVKAFAWGYDTEPPAGTFDGTRGA